MEPAGLQQLVRAFWGSDRGLVNEVRGRWRWRIPAATVPEIRELLARAPVGEAGGIDRDRLEVVALDANRPSDRPCEVLLYPVVWDGTALGPVDLILFYFVPKSQGGSAARDRAYFRVVEALNRWHDRLSADHPGRVVRAIDLPMPGWMRETLRPTSGNCCPLVDLPS